VKAFLAAARLVAEYFMPMAERVYGDAAASQRDRDAATLAKWIVKAKTKEVHVRHLQRVVRLHGLGTAEAIHAAAQALIEADWLRKPSSSNGRRPRMAYAVNPKVFEAVANGPATDVFNAHTTAPDTIPTRARATTLRRDTADTADTARGQGSVNGVLSVRQSKNEFRH
jgi:hypothetical protein